MIKWLFSFRPCEQKGGGEISMPPDIKDYLYQEVGGEIRNTHQGRKYQRPICAICGVASVAVIGV
jgi:hypothetical protein